MTSRIQHVIKKRFFIKTRYLLGQGPNKNLSNKIKTLVESGVGEVPSELEEHQRSDVQHCERPASLGTMGAQLRDPLKTFNYYITIILRG